MSLIRHWIDGKPDDATPGRTGPVYNPATGEQVAEVAFAEPADVDRAVAGARAAFASWRRSSLSQRTEILFRFRNLVEEHRDDLARLIVREHGKVLADARGEMRRGQEVIEFACGIPELLKGEFSENVSTNVDTYSILQPVGVVVANQAIDAE